MKNPQMKNKRTYHQMKSKNLFKAAVFAVTLVLPQLTANGATITVSGLVTNADGGSLYTIGQSVEIVFTTATSMGLPNWFDTSGVSSWAGSYASHPVSGVDVWSNITVSATVGTWHESAIEAHSGDYLLVNRALDMISLNSSSTVPITGVQNGLGLFNSGIELVYISSEVTLPSGALPSWPGAANSFVDNILPNPGSYLATPLTFFRLAFSDGSFYDVGDGADSLNVTVASIPEPSSAMLICVATSALFLRRRKE
jgi:hypothetical protein